jgi:hypothetical protein
VFIACFASSMVISTLGVALPRIAAELDGMRLFAWALALPGLASALSTLLSGKLSDLYGRRARFLRRHGPLHPDRDRRRCCRPDEDRSTSGSQDRRPGVGLVNGRQLDLAAGSVVGRLSLRVGLGSRSRPPCRFSPLLGRTVSPALLGSVMNAAYADALDRLLPEPLAQRLDARTLASIGDPRGLLSEQALAGLQAMTIPGQDPAAYVQGAEVVRTSLEAALGRVFLVGAVSMLVSFLLVLTIPEIELEAEAPGRPSKADARR